MHRHALGAGARGRDAVHGSRIGRDLASGIDEARPAPDEHAVHHRHECVRDRHVVEAVHAGGFEVEPE